MKSYPYVFFLIALSCSSSTNTTTETKIEEDTLATIQEEPMAQAEEESIDYVEQQQAQDDTVWLSDFAKDPLGFASYQGIVDYLRQEKIEFKDSIRDGDAYITVGSSYINVVINETYGDLICSALIDSPTLPLAGGLSIGMEREEFLKVTGVAAESITPGDSGKDFFKFDLIASDEGYWSLTFYFNKKSLTSFKYALSSCVIYD